MKIGVFLSKRDSFEGGGYTITKEIVETLISYLIKKKLQNFFFFIISNDSNNEICKRLKKNKIRYKKITENNFTRIIFTFISHFIKSSNILLNSLNILKINKIFKDNNCDRILFISSEYREKIYIPYFATVWDMQHETHPQFSEVSSFGKRLYKKIVNNRFIKAADTIIVGTKVGKSQVIKYTKFDNNFIILPHPVSKIFMKKKNKNIMKNKIKYFFYPANFWSHKNHINLIYGFKKFLKNNNNFILLFSGEKKNNYSNVLKTINKLNIRNKIKLVGHVSIKKLIKIYDESFAVIYSSFSGPENLPPLEALARNKILINSIYPGAKEQLKDFPIYVNPKSPDDIAKGMLKSLKIKLKSKRHLSQYLRSKDSKFYVKKLIQKLLKR